MATPKTPPAPGEPPIQLSAWMEEKGVSDSDLAQALGERRETIWKWQRYPTRLNPWKQSRVAAVLGLKTPALLWCEPGSQLARVIEAIHDGKPHDPLPKVPRPPDTPKGKRPR